MLYSAKTPVNVYHVLERKVISMDLGLDSRGSLTTLSKALETGKAGARLVTTLSRHAQKYM